MTSGQAETGRVRRQVSARRRLRETEAPRPHMIRKATAADARRVGRILSDWIDTTDWMPRIHTRDEDRLHAAQIIREMEVIVICRKRRLLAPRPVGFLARRQHFVHALYLEAGARGQGLGSALLEAAKAASPRLELWCFQANLPALAFYTAAGFTEVERGDGSGNDEGLPDLRLIWSKP